MIRYGLATFILLAALTVVATIYGTPTTPLDTATLAGVSLRLDYATTTAARERGLGGRASVPEDYGMLFVFSKPDYYGFWMKDMRVPIDIFWLDDKGRVISMERSVATSTYPRVFYPSVRARYVLETAAGFAVAHGTMVGMPLVLKNSLQPSPEVSE